jgi:hypothetical protein
VMAVNDTAQIMRRFFDWRESMRTPLCKAKLLTERR